MVLKLIMITGYDTLLVFYFWCIAYTFKKMLDIKNNEPLKNMITSIANGIIAQVISGFHKHNFPRQQRKEKQANNQIE
jgi:hypothetical protein